MAKVEVGCAGILVADTFCGPLDEIPPQGALVALDSMPTKAGGCAANVAIGLSKQGIAADVVGCLGRDPQANIILGLLEQAGVSAQHMSYSDKEPTSQTVALLVRGQDRRFLHVFGANKEFTVSHIDRDWLKSLKIFYLGGLYAMPSIKMSELLDVLRFCRSNGIVTVLDVVIARSEHNFDGLAELLQYVDYFTPNEDEARHITGLSDPLDQARVLQQNRENTVIITRGGAGCLAAKGSEVWRAGVFQVDVIDLTGSGDAFTAGLITGIIRKWDMRQTLSYASALGASSARAIGGTDGVFTAAEAQAFLAASPLDIPYEKLD